MRCLDLFCGTKSFTKIALKHGHECDSLDIIAKFLPTFCVNIMDWDYKLLPKNHYDCIWASPNCKDYSTMNFLSAKTKDLKDSDLLVEKVIEIIEYFDPEYWYIENPQTGLLKTRPAVFCLPYVVIDYCKYGLDIRKRTAIWTNNNDWIPKPLCEKNNYCKHKKKDGLHKNMRWITRGGGSSRWENRIFVPEKLIIEIVKSMT